MASLSGWLRRAVASQLERFTESPPDHVRTAEANSHPPTAVQRAPGSHGTWERGAFAAWKSGCQGRSWESGVFGEVGLAFFEEGGFAFAAFFGHVEEAG